MEEETEGSESERISDGRKSPVKGFLLTRIVVAFWLLGLCNNYIYVIMLSAAHDIIHKVEGPDSSNVSQSTILSGEGRNCTELTTGAVLLADIVPTLAVKAVFPFLPFLVHFRILLAITTGIISLIMVAHSQSITVALVGICFASFNSGLGEITLLAYSSNFVLHAIAGWSSGTGAAGLVGSLAYAGMTESGLTPEMSLLVSISIPLLMAASFWIILKHPDTTEKPKRTRNLDLALLIKSLAEEIKFIPQLLPYMIPVGLVYYFEYLINSGLFDKFEFQNTSISKSSQFRWFNVAYQIGVFISRSSVTWIQFERVWIMSVLQLINFLILFLETIYGFIPNVYIIFAIIFWEGLLGGAAYVNTFYVMSYKIEENRRLFALSVASIADTFGIVFSGLTAFPLHKFICSLPFKPIFRYP